MGSPKKKNKNYFCAKYIAIMHSLTRIYIVKDAPVADTIMHRRTLNMNVLRPANGSFPSRKMTSAHFFVCASSAQSFSQHIQLCVCFPLCVPHHFSFINKGNGIMIIIYYVVCITTATMMICWSWWWWRTSTLCAPQKYPSASVLHPFAIPRAASQLRLLRAP